MLQKYLILIDEIYLKRKHYIRSSFWDMFHPHRVNNFDEQIDLYKCKISKSSNISTKSQIVKILVIFENSENFENFSYVGHQCFKNI